MRFWMSRTGSERKTYAAMRVVSLLALTLAAAGAGGPAMAAESACLMKSQIRSWTAPDDRHLVITDASNHKYTVTLLGACTGLRFTESLAVRKVGNSLCVEKGDSIAFRGGGLPQRCMISDISSG